MAKLDWFLALGSAAVATAAFEGGRLLALALPHASGFEGALWAGVSAVVVLQATRDKTNAAAKLRVIGTAVGAVLSWLTLQIAPYSLLGLAACIFATVLVCERIGVPDDARLASATVIVIMALSVLHPEMPPWLNAGLRFAESVIGAVCALAWAWLARQLGRESPPH